MKATSAPPPRRPSLIVVCALLAALGCALAAIAVGSVNTAALIAQRIGQARGSMSPETLAWLQGLDVRALLGWSAAAFAVAALIAWRTQSAWQAWLARPPSVTTITTTDRAISRSSPHRSFIVIACGVAVFARWWPTLAHGYFRFDDFDLLAVARDHTWWHAFWLPNGDHFLPLTRVIASMGYALFGVTAWPYNLGVLLCFWAMITMGCLLLDELNVSRTAQFLFVALVVLWSPWGEIASGYYILSSYTLIAALGLAAVWLYLRWRVAGRKLRIAGSALCVLVATLVDVSGWYVPAALGVFLWADFTAQEKTRSWRTWLTVHRPLLLSLALVVAASLACTVYAYAVINRGSFLSMAGGGTRTLARLAADFAYLFDVGLLVTFVIPFVYARLSLALLAGVAVAVLLLWSAFIAAAVRRATRSQRLVFVTLATVLAGTCLMVTLGRHPEEIFLVRWAAKHAGPSFVWLCLLLAAAWDTLWMHAHGRGRILMAELTLVLLGVFCLAQTAFGHLGLAVAFPPFGYPAEIRDAVARRAAVADLREKIIVPIARATGGPMTVPTLDGPYVAARHISLFEYDLSTYTPFFRDASRAISFVRNAAMQNSPTRAITTVPVLRDAVSPAFLVLLARDRNVREIYFASVPLRATPQPSAPTDELALTLDTHGTSPQRDADGATQVESDGRLELLVRGPAFDPETAPRLRLALERLDAPAGAEVIVALTFTSDIAGAKGGGTIALRPRAGQVAEIDLRQMYAFALSQRVADLRLILTQPGRYRLRVVTLAP